MKKVCFGLTLLLSFSLSACGGVANTSDSTVQTPIPLPGSKSVPTVSGSSLETISFHEISFECNSAYTVKEDSDTQMTITLEDASKTSSVGVLMISFIPMDNMDATETVQSAIVRVAVEGMLESIDIKNPTFEESTIAGRSSYHAKGVRVDGEQRIQMDVVAFSGDSGIYLFGYGEDGQDLLPYFENILGSIQISPKDNVGLLPSNSSSSKTPEIPEHIKELEAALNNAYVDLNELGGAFVDYESGDEYAVSFTFSGYEANSFIETPDVLMIIIKEYVDGMIDGLEQSTLPYHITSVEIPLLADGVAVGTVSYNNGTGKYILLLNGEVTEY